VNGLGLASSDSKALKFELISNWLHSNDLDIATIQESHTLSNDPIPSFEGYSSFISSILPPDIRRHLGVITLVKNHIRVIKSKTIQSYPGPSTSITIIMEPH